MMMFQGQAALGLLLMLAISGPVVAQHRGGATMHSGGSPTAASMPYAGMDQRIVKALSDPQIADLKAGRGMGLALAAELNGYPGPSHVLELADALQLSDAQRDKTKALLDAMKAETIPLGERLIAGETALDRLFATKTVTPASLDEATSRISAMQGTLRAAHLRYHLAMLEVLSAPQVAHYAELRGYAAGNVHR
jgi:hypothetical protein